MFRRILTGAVILVVVAVLVVYAAGRGWFGRHEGPGEIAGPRLEPAVVAGHAAAVTTAARRIGVDEPKQVLFGDLHVHTTFSADAFMMNLPLLSGEGSHPPADACDFARYCSTLDFWSINDHAEGISPANWAETVESIRQCNAVAGDAADPDVVAYLGWEWTQVGATPADHYGHKNVVLRGLDDDQVTTRPIASRGISAQTMRASPGVFTRGYLALAGGESRYHDMARFLSERVDLESCPDGVDVRDLPTDCLESAGTPDVLFEKLRQWNVPAIVIPHGTTWGFYTPPGSTWDKQLQGPMHDPNLQRLIEVFSGHGNSEEYRDWQAVRFDAQGKAHCPEPRPDYMPSCWRAGEIIGERCQQEGIAADECARRVEQARQFYADAAVAGHLVVPGVKPEEWLDSGQCKDCFQPAFNYRPGSSAQYIQAISDFGDPQNPRRFRFGFMASSDVHTARPGTGYKEYNRSEMTEGAGARSPEERAILLPPPADPSSQAIPFDPVTRPMQGFQLVEAERQASFFLPGGLAAVHSSGRDRDSIWQALERREVYGTSGPRILLWFDLLNPPGSTVALPMGSETRMGEAPRFRVRAVGSLEQKPGCPEYSVESLSPERLQKLCQGECYNPSDVRRKISRIEVIRIQPQVKAGEEVRQLIEDPWRVFECPGDPAGCAIEFSDDEFPGLSRDTLYYARAVEEPSKAVNAKSLRCVYDDQGNCRKVDPCWGDFRTPFADDCLSPTEERAWSSPIFVDYASTPVS